MDNAKYRLRITGGPRYWTGFIGHNLKSKSSRFSPVHPKLMELKVDVLFFSNISWCYDSKELVLVKSLQRCFPIKDVIHLIPKSWKIYHCLSEYLGYADLDLLILLGTYQYRTNGLKRALPGNPAHEQLSLQHLLVGVGFNPLEKY